MRRERISLARRSLGEGGCSMRITEDVRKYAASQKLSEAEALHAGMEQKAREFNESGAEIYSKV
jgi:phosphomethylpyrimidine synthase